MRLLRYGATIASVAVIALLAGCESGSGAAPLSLSGLTKTAESLGTKGAGTCPLPYDIAKATKAAGVDASAGTGSVKDADEPVATGEVRSDNPVALVSCTFHIGEESVHVHTAATDKPQANAQLAPLIQYLAGLSLNDLIAYTKKAGEAKAGEPVLTDGGTVAVVRLKLDGEGDATLLVGVGESGHSALSRDQVGKLAKALTAQVQ
ncbi:hypothetical protein ACFWBN_22020 [Streptomyces sp. NPDC059989]|uniref:hypothetical protein n=1 Tax=Streptomyces sp. NPDC059989 TaxID=3347026 RepID=UPI0036B20497